MDGMGVGMEIALTGFPDLERKLAALGALDFDPLLEDIGVVTERQTLDRFDKESDPSGRPWRPLAASTVLQKLRGENRGGKARRNLVYGKRGRMVAKARRRMGAIKILQEAGHQGGLVDTVASKVQGDHVTTGVNKVYAAIQQFGGAGTRRPGIPARPYLGFGAHDIQEVHGVAGRWLVRKIAE
jgi:phage gpG-like protein